MFWFYSLIYSFPVFPASLTEETFSIAHSCLLCHDELTVGVCVYFWASYSAPLISILFCASTILLLFCLLFLWSMFWSQGSWFLQLVCLCQDCFGYSGSFVFPYKLKTFFSGSVGNATGNLIGVALNLYIALGHTVTVTQYIFPSLCIIFSFFHQCLTVLGVQVFYFLSFQSKT